MIIRNLDIESFGRFSGVSFEFRRGLNLVTGPNEAGKSTLAEAIPAVLFGSRQAERFKPWGRSGCSARLVFEGEGRTVEVRRDLLSDQVSLVERDDLYQVLSSFEGRAAPNGRNGACREYRQLLERLLGLADDNLFRATCFFGQQPKEWTGDELGGKLRTLVSGREEADYSRLLDQLLEEHFQLTSKNPWGRDKQKDRPLEKLQARLAEIPATAGSEALPSTAAAAETAERIRSLAKEIEHDRAEYVKGVCYVDHLRQKSQRPAKTSAAEPVVEQAQSAAAPASAGTRDPGGLQGRLQAAGLPADPPRELPDLLEEAAQIRQELAEVKQPLANLTREKEKVRPVPWLMGGVASLLLAAVIAGGFLFGFYPVALAMASGAVLALLWGGLMLLHAKRRRRRAEFDRRIAKLEQTRAAVLDRQGRLSERCETLGLPSSAVDLVRLQKLVNANRELLDNWWAGGSRDAASGPAGTTPTPAEAGKAPQPAAQAEAEEEQADLAELEHRLAEFVARLKEKEAELARLRQTGEQQDSSGSAQAAPISDLEAEYRQMERRVALLRLQVDLLVAGIEDFRTTHLGSLTAEAGRLFGRMTGGRYTVLRLDDEMRPEVRVGERRWIPADRLSRGTLDALYLALRIALAKVRSDGRVLPMLLDDPFVHLDRSRMTAVAKLLDMAAAGSQLIIFSHSEELARRAARERWHVVSLGEETTGARDKDDEHAGQLHLL